MKWRTIDACDVSEHIAIRTASSQPAVPGFSTPSAVSMWTGASSPDPGLEPEVDHGAELDEPGVALEAGERRADPTGTPRLRWPRGSWRRGWPRPSPRGRAPAAARAREAAPVRRRVGVRPARPRRRAAIGGTPVLHRREPLHQPVLEPGEQPLRGVGLVGGDVVGDDDTGERDVGVLRGERDQPHGARVGGAGRDHRRLLALELEHGEPVPERPGAGAQRRTVTGDGSSSRPRSRGSGRRWVRSPPTEGRSWSMQPTARTGPARPTSR